MYFLPSVRRKHTGTNAVILCAIENICQQPWNLALEFYIRKFLNISNCQTVFCDRYLSVMEDFFK